VFLGFFIRLHPIALHFISDDAVTGRGFTPCRFGWQKSHRLFNAPGVHRMRRKSVKKTGGWSVKKFSLSDDHREEFGKF